MNSALHRLTQILAGSVIGVCSAALFVMIPLTWELQGQYGPIVFDQVVLPVLYVAIPIGAFAGASFALYRGLRNNRRLVRQPLPESSNAGSAHGWTALTLGFAAWSMALANPTARSIDLNAWEPRLFQAAAFGASAAIAIGLAVGAIRRNRRCWVGWLALLVASALLLWSADQIGRWHFCDRCVAIPKSILFG